MTPKPKAGLKDRADREPRARSGKHLHAGVLVRAPDAEREAWDAAAAAAGLPRAEWIRGELNAAAARQVLPPDLRRPRRSGILR